jgi:uroporphyrinogen decarboxylase
MVEETLEKRDRLRRTLAGEPTDRVPVALWRRWPGDDLRSADFAQAVIDFQQRYDWDIVVLCPYSAYGVVDYGAFTTWEADLSGDRVVTKSPVTRSLAWTELRVLDPMRGELGKYLTTVQFVTEAVSDAPVVAAVYSPLAQARLLAGDLAIRNMRTHPARLRTGLNTLTETTLLFLESLKRTAIEGILYVVDSADYSLMTKEEYVNIGLPYDRKILDALPESWWLNTLQISGPAPMFEFLKTYPMPLICWDLHESKPDLDKALALSEKKVLMTGLSPEAHLHRGTPQSIGSVARSQITLAGGRRLLLAAGGAVPVTSPVSNLRAVRSAVESATLL